MFGLGKNDNQIQQDVSSEILWDPRISSSHISASTKDGIVTLRGSVPHFMEKAAAEGAAQRVSGVRAVADEIEVELMGSFERSDEDIAAAALNAMKWSYSVPGGIQVVVDKGWLTLSGTVDWNYQRNSAQETVCSLMGVRGVTNHISLKASTSPADVKKLIENALKRSAASESRNITVSVEGHTVTLSGSMKTFDEISDARLAAWNAPGITYVKNNLTLAN